MFEKLQLFIRKLWLSMFPVPVPNYVLRERAKHIAWTLHDAGYNLTEDQIRLLGGPHAIKEHDEGVYRR